MIYPPDPDVRLAVGLMCTVDINNDVGTTPLVLTDKVLNDNQLAKLLGTHRVVHLKRKDVFQYNLENI